MSAVATLKQWSAETAEAILSPIIEAGEARRRETEDATAAAKREQLAQFDKAPKDVKAALAAKAKAESDHARAVVGLSEARRVFDDAESVLVQRQFEHAHALKTLRKGAVAKYRTDAAFAVLFERVEAIRASGLSTATEAIRVVVQAQHAVTACAAGDADPPAADFDAWLADVLSRADAAFEAAKRAAVVQRAENARADRARNLMT